MIMEKERKQVVEFSKKLLMDNLTKGTAGNISVFNSELGYIAISPSGIDYNTMLPEDVVIIDLNKNVIESSRKPSSELDLHLLIYKNKPDMRAVVHTHSMYCTILGAINEPIKAVHYVLADANSAEVPIAPYRTYGTKELAQVVSETMGKCNACLMQNHGMIACGTTIESAYGLVATCEWVAEIQWKSLCVRQPNYLSDEQMSIVSEKFRSYGQVKNDNEIKGYFS